RISRMISSSSITRMVPCRDVAIVVLSPLAGCRVAPAEAGLRIRVAQRQRHREPRSLADDAVAANGAVVLVHDAVGDRQAETGAAADAFRREERIVDAREMLGGNAGSGVRHFDDRA